MKHIAIFASGNGSNAENLIKYFNDSKSTARVELIVCNRDKAGVVNRARNLNIPVEIINAQFLNDNNKMSGLLDLYSADVIILAGFLMMIPPYLIRRYEGRILNIHPSLLPAYGGKGMYGRKVHEAVIAAGEKESGVTVHLVSEEYDKGEIIAQKRIEISTDDDANSLETKIHTLEYEYFPQIVEDFIKSI